MRLMALASGFAFVLSGMAVAQQCRQAKFNGRVEGGDTFNQPLGSDLEFEIWPLRNEGGEIKVEPHGFAKDWAYVVTPPWRLGNAQWMGNGYGETVRYQLSYLHEIRFVLTAADYERMFTLVRDGLWPYNAKDPEHVGDAYLDALGRVPTGLVAIKPTGYDKLGASDQARWMEFEATVTVPKTFAASNELKWAKAPCPPPPK